MTAWQPGRRILQARQRLEILRANYAWDERAASEAVRFIERNIKHWKEPHTGKPFILSEWQRDDIVRPIWGLRKADGTRLIREVYLQVPRKNGKTALAAALALLVMCRDGDGLELYSAATKRDQANIVFRDVVQFVKRSPALRARMRTFENKVTYPKRGNSFCPLSAEYNNLDGLNTSFAVIDELHAHPSAHLHDVLMTSTGSRSQPLVLKITTAGASCEGVCHDQFEYACHILDGIVKDDGYLAFIAEADPSLPWNSPAAYEQANPNLGISVGRDYLERERCKASEQPSYRSTFERYHLDRWVQGGVEKWIPTDQWRACGDDYTADDLAGAPCYGGLDLASTTDLCAFSLVFPQADGGVRSLQWYWLPAERLHDRAESDRVPYDVWAREGWIELTPGKVTDYSYITAKVLELRERFNLRNVAYDDWNALQVHSKLDAEGVPMVKFVQGVRSYHTPSTEFERLVAAGLFHHNRNPVSAWMAANVQVLRDVSGKIRPVKDNKSSRNRIDGIVASIMALDCHLRESCAGTEAPIDYAAIPDNLRALLGA